MSNLVINDLVVSKDLDRAAATQIFGGMGFLSALVARERHPALGGFLPGSIATVINNIHLSYNVFNNATILNVNNGSNNSGGIVNDINFSPLTLSAGSPTLIGTPSGS